MPDLPVSSTSFRDRDGRQLRIATLGAGPRTDERAALEAMYGAYDTADRAQGLPPVAPEALSRWLDRVLEGSNVLAWDDRRVVGHVGLYPVEAGYHELIIFIDSEYQGAGIGSELLSNLLSAHRERGGGVIKLSVEPTNRAAINLYQKFDFEVETETALEIQMRREI
jgi:ribosomal protein S18 acetylase RimI-like enzyme